MRASLLNWTTKIAHYWQTDLSHYFDQKNTYHIIGLTVAIYNYNTRIPVMKKKLFMFIDDAVKDIVVFDRNVDLVKYRLN